ncbi:TonB-dependent receptor [Montanilutibacter psychrotolerans]|uniref:TonB-dependent receptor n=1 Tax=Montanilutibacter psychrotolerans TaxID=1327343 RepID=A0A3M8SVM9_9GAMM|nr:carboxypeptidase regulatory-like domain-containing protein [Lysobacter psychrotolerans]RNF85397.1 TonB-dependent receptor [Lysobacter psychrotolerans]
MKALRRSALCLALGMCLASLAPMAVASDGSVVGRTAPGAEVTVRNPATGFSRIVQADASGSYRFPFLPVGSYVLEVRKDGATLGEPVEINVSLGNATHVSAAATGGVSTLDSVEVVGSRVVNAVDVSSTESATNVTREELARLPVERDPLAVALLAPGLTKGEFGGVSFGGSSVAENTVYINGLNVTDFYNRVGFSSVPYAFYKEFQVKTGGYSVEFGRTTGGVINAVTRSGSNAFEFGAEAAWEPAFLQTSASDHYGAQGNPEIIASHDEYDRSSVNFYASGPIIRDRLFFFAMYELRDYQPQNTTDLGDSMSLGNSDDAFWGGKLDWQISDSHQLELLAFSDQNATVTKVHGFDLGSGRRTGYQNTRFLDNGGRNWSLTYTGYLTDALSMKALYGENERQFSQKSLNDIDCNRVRDLRDGISKRDVGCTNISSVIERGDEREAARLDFEWALGGHLLRFGMDREVNTSHHQQYYPGNRLLYEIRDTQPGTTLDNGGTVPDDVFAYVRTRTNEVDGQFESVNTAYYIEDNWAVTPGLVLNAGLRLEAFDNKDSDGRSYIKMDDMLAPRLGFSWDLKGNASTKLFGNLGRYFLPVANVINIKQAGGFFDERTFYVFEGFEDFEYNGQIYQRPILGAQIGPVDNSQGDGTVGDLRAEVDSDMDPVYQDELILGYQSMIDEKWSWGVRGIYRKLHNAIDDMFITSNGILCGGEPSEIGWVMANPGENVTVYTDTNCDGESDGYVTIDTSTAGWALYDHDGNYLGERGWSKPRRDYKALELTLDRAWDDTWSFNASYTLAFNKGNAEGPINSDTDFSDTGRTENFDDPWVNFGGYGYLPNDRRHQFKFRGGYAFSEHWQVGATLTAQSGRPVNAFGAGNPFDGTNYHSYYICVSNCTATNPSERVYQHYGRGAGGNLGWTYDVGANISYLRSFGDTRLRVKLAVYNLLNQERVTEVDDELEADIGFRNPEYLQGTDYQSPRYAQFTVSVDF